MFRVNSPTHILDGENLQKILGQYTSKYGNWNIVTVLYNLIIIHEKICNFNLDWHYLCPYLSQKFRVSWLMSTVLLTVKP